MDHRPRSDTPSTLATGVVVASANNSNSSSSHSSSTNPATNNANSSTTSATNNQQQPANPPVPTNAPAEKSTTNASAKKRKRPIHRRLVSYNDDTIVSDGENNDDDDEDDDDEDSNSDDDEDGAAAAARERGNGGASPSMDANNGDGTEASATSDSNASSETGNSAIRDRAAEYGFSLPPEAKGRCPSELQDKIAHMHAKMRAGMDMNRLIQDRKEFRNPSIYEKLIQFCDINELGTNYPPHIYDPLQWGRESFYEELAGAQKTEMERRERDRKEGLKQQLVVEAAGFKKEAQSGQQRKSKWDQPAPGVVVMSGRASDGSSAAAAAAAATATALQAAKAAGAAAVAAAAAAAAAGLVQPNATGTKGTVISAFGSLPKKPKV